MGQFAQRNYVRGVLFFTTYLFLLGFTIEAFHTTLIVRSYGYPVAVSYNSWWQLAVFPILLVAVVWAAMVEAAWHSVPPAPRESPNSIMRFIRICLACAAVAGFVYSIIFSVLGTR
jgi:hypothetical protein